MVPGFLLLAAFLSGQLATQLGLPRITGYLGCGLVLGPEVLGLVSAGEVEGFGAINAMAVAVRERVPAH